MCSKETRRYSHRPLKFGVHNLLARLSIGFLAILQVAGGWQGELFDVVVYGATPGGISAALSAAGQGRRVALVAYNTHVGGMMTSGLGKSDVENRAMIGGLFREFTRRVKRTYVARYGAESENAKLCRDGYYYEPSVAESVLESMLQEQSGITVFRGWRVESATVETDALRSVEFEHRRRGERQTLASRVFVDATYEGDLYAAAGAEFRLGRESRDAFNEPHAGVVYFDYQRRVFLPGTTGEASELLPAYTYRLCLTRDPENAYRLAEPPPGYDRGEYLGLLRGSGRGPPRRSEGIQAGKGLQPGPL